MRFPVLVWGLATIGLSSCATLTRTNVVDFTVETEPAGAVVKTSTGFLCTSPCTIKHPRKDGFDVTVSKLGFKTVDVHVASKLAAGGAAGVAGNVIVGGVFGIAADAMSGAADDLVPNPIKLKLEPQS
jgi:hypothetical protein